MIRQVLYVSHATRGTDARVAREILAASQTNNWRLDITGILMFSGLRFAQVLEGKADSVQGLLDKVACDTRHGGMRLLVDREVRWRAHGDWSMGYLFRSELSEALMRLESDTPTGSPEALAFLETMTIDTVMGAL